MCVDRDLCDGPIPRPEESYRVCVLECDQVQQQPSTLTMTNKNKKEREKKILRKH
jgi:hypothetical protein